MTSNPHVQTTNVRLLASPLPVDRVPCSGVHRDHRVEPGVSRLFAVKHDQAFDSTMRGAERCLGCSARFRQLQILADPLAGEEWAIRKAPSTWCYVEPGKGIEPLTYALQVRCSAS